MSAYLPCDSDEASLSKKLKKLLTTAVGIKCSSLLDVRPMHFTLYLGAQTSFHEEKT